MHALSMYDILKELTVILFTLAGGCKGQGNLFVNKEAAQNFRVKRFNSKRLSELKVRNQYRIMILIIQAADTLVPESTVIVLDMPIENLIPEKFIKAQDRKIRLEIQTFINSIWNKEEFPEEWKE
jgi:hypothetical protein